MKTVLIVDRDEWLLHELAQLLPLWHEEVTTRTASNGHDAVELLVSEHIDLLIAEPGISVRDGVGLIDFAQSTFPGVMLMAMIERADDDQDWRCDVDGVVYADRPPPVEDLQNKVNEMLKDQICGHIEHLGLGALLQLIELERKSCAITVASEARIGRLYINAGRLVAAQTDSCHGQEAAIDIATWPDPEIDIERLTHVPVQTIDAPLSFIIMESVRLTDERLRVQRAADGLPPLAEGTPTHMSRSAVAELVEAMPSNGADAHELWEVEDFVLDVMDEDEIGEIVAGGGGEARAAGGEGGAPERGDDEAVRRALTSRELRVVCAGAVAVVVIDSAASRCVAAVTSEAIPDVDGFAGACAHALEVTHGSLRRSAADAVDIDDVIITTTGHHCLLRPIPSAGDMFAAMLVRRREGVHLAAARMGLRLVADMLSRAVVTTVS